MSGPLEDPEYVKRARRYFASAPSYVNSVFARDGEGKEYVHAIRHFAWRCGDCGTSGNFRLIEEPRSFACPVCGERVL